MSMLGRMFGFGRNEHYDRGIRLFDLGKFEEAIAELNQVVKRGKEGARSDALTQRLASFYIAEAYANLGMSALVNQGFEKAEEYLGKALAVNPHYADLHFHYGRACRAAGHTLQAISAFENALRINRRFAKAHFHLGLALYEADRPAEALEHIRDAVTLERGFQTDEFANAIARHDAGDYAGAYAVFQSIAETDVDEIAIHAKQGVDLYRRGLHEEAAEEFRAALALNGNYADLRNHLGIALNAQRLYEEAAVEFGRALEINPLYLEARTNLALTLNSAGKSAEASEQFRKILEQDPLNSVALSNLRQ